jgi:hypothetical protein
MNVLHFAVRRFTEYTGLAVSTLLYTPSFAWTAHCEDASESSGL